MIQLENNDKLGFYMLGGKKFYTKPEALVEATKTGIFPEWNFNRNVFDSYNWSVEPNIDIKELYRLRALQLREKYDYLILAYSGGADSHNILLSFMRQNIHIDEIENRIRAS